MTAPRQVLPGTTYLVTRRCSERRFFLRPSKKTNEIFRYVLAVAARRFDVQVHIVCVLSNHFHLVVTDPAARLPAFEQYLDSLVARAVNASLGRWESFWAPSTYSAVALASPSDIVEKCAYVLANPVAAGLVRAGREWPGLWSAPEGVGGPGEAVGRPDFFFRASGTMPEAVELELTVPPGFGSASEFREALASALARREAEALGALASQRRGVMGASRVLSQKPNHRPAAEEPRRTLRPRVAARDRWKRVEVLARLMEFVRSYREAWRRMREGARDVLFPAGTYLLRIQHGVRCAPSG